MSDALPYASRPVTPRKPASRWSAILGVAALALGLASLVLPHMVEASLFLGLLVLVFIGISAVLAIVAFISGIRALLQVCRKPLAISGLAGAVLTFPIVYFALTSSIEWATAKAPESKERAAQAQLSNLISALATFQQENGRYPTTAEGLGAMVKCPPGLGASWHQLMDEVPTDSWERPFYYTCPDPKDPTTFDLSSAGPDGILANADDITKAKARW